jgi:hypothetical protein
MLSRSALSVYFPLQELLDSDADSACCLSPTNYYSANVGPLAYYYVSTRKDYVSMSHSQRHLWRLFAGHRLIVRT